MFSFNTDMKGESITIAKWLVSIPSVTGTDGESVITQAIEDGIRDFPYFSKEKALVRHVSHEGRGSLIALVKSGRETRQTIAVITHLDTPGVERYGSLKRFACTPDQMRSRIIEHDDWPTVTAELKESGTICGLGISSCKGVAGCAIAALKSCSDVAATLPVNLVFLFLTGNMDHHAGIKACQTELAALLGGNGLDLTLGLEVIPNPLLEDKHRLPLFVSNYAKASVSFFILGESAHEAYPYTGFSPTLIASALVRRLEVNSGLRGTAGQGSILPIFNNILLRPGYGDMTAESLHLNFQINYEGIEMGDLIERFKELSAQALEDTANTWDAREGEYRAQSEIEGGRPEIRDAEVLSYSDLFTRAERHSKGNLDSAVKALLGKYQNSGMSEIETCAQVVERLNELARLPKPSIVISLNSDFVPQQEVRNTDFSDRELLITLSAAMHEFNKRHNLRLELKSRRFAPPSDGNYLRPIGIDEALRQLTRECPMAPGTFYNLGAPVVTLCHMGVDQSLVTERASDQLFTLVPDFLAALISAVSGEAVEFPDDEGQGLGKDSAKAKDPAKGKEPGKQGKEGNEPAPEALPEGDKADGEGTLGQEPGTEPAPGPRN
ncbi:MAG: hypothetical protein K6A65_02585 [Succinivibrionaceae bacterium]|nr:hypothetical protein [Succinivibrionaceae bacterium]